MQELRQPAPIARAADPIDVLDALLDMGLPSSDVVVCALKLWNLVGRQAAKAVVTAAQLAGLVRANDPRTARNWLDRLDAVGLIRILDRNKGRGSYTVYVYDPLVVAQAHCAKPVDDSQQELEFEPAAVPFSPPAEEASAAVSLVPAPGGAETCAHEFPRRGIGRASVSAETCAHTFPRRDVRAEWDAINSARDQAPQSEKATSAPALRHSDIEVLTSSQDIDIGHSDIPNVESSLAQRAGPCSIGESLAGAIQQTNSPARLEREKRRIASEIAGRVRDPDLEPGPRFRAATAIADGTRFNADELERLLAKLDRTQPRNRGAYFVVSLKRRFRELGIAWSQHPP
jgi:hypothetical protein